MDLSTTLLKPQQMALAVLHAIKARLPAFIWGPPGCAKSSVVAQVAESINHRLIDLRAGLLDPVDLRGLPHLNGDSLAHWASPAFLPHDDTPTVLFLDELPQAPPMVQNACSSLLLDRRLGEYVLPDSVVMVAAGNREGDRAATNRLPSHIAGRFSPHLEMAIDLDQWCQWAIANGIRPEIVAFVRFRPELLYHFDPLKTDEKAYPSLRTWEFASRQLDTNLPPEIEHQVMCGTVGSSTGTELVSFLRIYRELPNPDAVLMNPQSAEVPDSPAVMYALCGALSRKATPTSIDRIVTYAERIPAEFSVLLIKDAVQLCPEAQNSAAFVRWAAANGDVLV